SPARAPVATHADTRMANTIERANPRRASNHGPAITRLPRGSAGGWPAPSDANDAPASRPGQCLPASGRGLPGALHRRVLDVAVEPLDDPRPVVEDALLPRRPVVLVRVFDQRGRLAETVQRFEHPLRLDRVGADVGVVMV